MIRKWSVKDTETPAGCVTYDGVPAGQARTNVGSDNLSDQDRTVMRQDLHDWVDGHPPQQTCYCEPCRNYFDYPGREQRELLVQCYRSGQMTEAQWNQHCRDDPLLDVRTMPSFVTWGDT